MNRSRAGLRPRWPTRVAGVRVTAAAALVLALLLAPPVLGAATPSGSGPMEAEPLLERRVKAAFLFRFTEFVTWPETAYPRLDSPFRIVVIGRDAIADGLRQITAGRMVNGRAVEVKRLSEGEAMPAAQMMFIAEPNKQRLREWLRLAPRNTLVVTEADGALAQGSVINFILVDGRVRFEISLEAAEKRGLLMSSRLLAVAQSVRTGNP